MSAVAESRLSRMALFMSLPPEAVGELARRCRVLELGVGTAISAGLCGGFDLLVVLSGRLRVSGEDPSGGVVDLRELARGDVVWELTTIDGRPPPRSMTALQAAEVAVFTREELLCVGDEHPGFALSILGHLAAVAREYERRAVAGWDARQSNAEAASGSCGRERRFVSAGRQTEHLRAIRRRVRTPSGTRGDS